MILWLCSVALAGDLFIQGARVWDGLGASLSGPQDVLVHDDRIVAVGPGLTAPEGAEVLDAAGATVMPGLIDSHVHLSMDPGAAWRQDTPEQHVELLRRSMAAYLACGVTTVLDTAVRDDELHLIRDLIDGGAPAPRFLTLGTPFSPQGGYPAAVVPGLPTVGSPEQVEGHFTLLEGQRVDGIKVTVEDGPGQRIWPLYSPEVAAAIRAGAASRGLRVFAHGFSPDAVRFALDALGADVLVHPFHPTDRALVERLARERVPVMSTLAPFGGFRYEWDPELLDDPWIRRVVPEIELAVVRDRVIKRRFLKTFLHTLAPSVPLPGLVSRLTRPMVARETRALGETVRALQHAGAPVIMGSDAGNWPLFPFLFHGPSTQLELELLADAGLTPLEILTASTSAPASMLGLQGEVGRVAPGAVADLVIVDGDPLQDVAAMRHVRWTIRAGVARTPEGWMAASGASQREAGVIE